MAATCSRLSRRASKPPWILGWSVLTRPSIISGKPVTARNIGHGQPRFAQELGGAAGADEFDAEFLVQGRGELGKPVLSETEIKARLTGTRSEDTGSQPFTELNAD